MSYRTPTWFVTGAARGLGAQIAKAALAAGHCVVATARQRSSIALEGERLLALDLDVTDAAQAHAAVQATVARFGRIDVLVNNAGYGQMGMFEEVSAAQVQAQFDTNVFGLMHVSRAVIPVMRAQRAGRIFNISSIGGIQGSYPGASVYCASKFAVEGFSEGLAQEVAPFGIGVTIVEPGFFRTDFLDAQSVRYGSTSVADYAAQSADSRATYSSFNHQQPGDPAKLAAVLLQLADHPAPPLRFAAGSDAVAVVDNKIATLRSQLQAWQALSVTTDGNF